MDLTDLLGSIGANLHALRVNRGLTQARLAELAGLDVRFLQRIERGRTNLGVAVLVALAGALAVAPARLLRAAKLPPVQRGRPRGA